MAIASATARYRPSSLAANTTACVLKHLATFIIVATVSHGRQSSYVLGGLLVALLLMWAPQPLVATACIASFPDQQHTARVQKHLATFFCCGYGFARAPEYLRVGWLTGSPLLVGVAHLLCATSHKRFYASTLHKRCVLKHLAASQIVATVSHGRNSSMREAAALAACMRLAAALCRRARQQGTQEREGNVVRTSRISRVACCSQGITQWFAQAVRLSDDIAPRSTLTLGTYARRQ